MISFILGATSAAAFVIALFFLNYWQKTKDRFFALFALAFTLLCANRLVFGVFEIGSEHAELVYLLRLLAFVIILLAIWDKNRAEG